MSIENTPKTKSLYQQLADFFSFKSFKSSKNDKQRVAKLEKRVSQLESALITILKRVAQAPVTKSVTAETKKQITYH